MRPAWWTGAGFGNAENPQTAVGGTEKTPIRNL